MNAGKRVGVACALLVAGSLAALPPVASATTTGNPGVSAGAVSRSPALHGQCGDPSSVTGAFTSREIGSPACATLRLKFLQGLEAAAIKQRDFEQVQGLELQLAPLRHQTKSR